MDSCGVSNVQSVNRLRALPDLFYEVQPLWESLDYDGMREAVPTFADPITRYVAERFTVNRGGGDCTPAMAGDVRIEDRQEVPYAFITFEFACPESHLDEVRVTSNLFPDSEEYVKDTKTVVEFDVAGASGTAALDAATPTFSSLDSWTKRFTTFFHLQRAVDPRLSRLSVGCGRFDA